MNDKRRELQKLLGTLDSEMAQDRSLERERTIERNRHAYRFRELKKSDVLPALREVMLDLEKKGHLTRLTERSPEKVRLDIQIHGRDVRRGAIEIALHDSEPGKFQVSYAWGWDQAQQVYSLDQLGRDLVADRILHLLKKLLEGPASRARV